MAAGISPAAVCVLLGLEENAVTAQFLAGGMIQCASGLFRQIFIVSCALLIPQYGDGVGFGGMGLGKGPDLRQPIKIRLGHPKIEIPAAGFT